MIFYSAKIISSAEVLVKKHYSHIVASNLDKVLLFVTLRSPRTSVGFIDRFLVSAESFRIPVVIVFNKTDLYRKQEDEKSKVLSSLYESLGYKCLNTSIIENIGIKEVENELKNCTSLISGHSGVGKSSLLNLIHPDLELKIGGLTKFTDKGSHTTTFAEMYELGENTYIIDSPGIKEFAPENMEKVEIDQYFPEMRKLIGQCKYHNCLHQNEPDCAVMNAFEEDKISEHRYNIYLTLLEEVEAEQKRY